MNWKDKIICPGCGTIYKSESNLGEFGECQSCRYENGLPPFRLLTISEILESDGDWNDVKLGPFLKSFMFLEEGNFDIHH